jgi:Zn-finger nucleic acid-binding protein
VAPLRLRDAGELTELLRDGRQQAIERDDAEQCARSVDDRHASHAARAHRLDRLAHCRVRGNGKWIVRHHLANREAVEVSTPLDLSTNDVPIGKHPHRALSSIPGIDHDQCTDITGTHLARGGRQRLVRKSDANRRTANIAYSHRSFLVWGT